MKKTILLLLLATAKIALCQSLFFTSIEPKSQATSYIIQIDSEHTIVAMVSREDMYTPNPITIALTDKYSFILINEQGEEINRFTFPKEEYAYTFSNLYYTNDTIYSVGYGIDMESHESTLFLYKLSKELDSFTAKEIEMDPFNPGTITLYGGIMTSNNTILIPIQSYYSGNYLPGQLIEINLSGDVLHSMNIYTPALLTAESLDNEQYILINRYRSFDNDSTTIFLDYNFNTVAEIQDTTLPPDFIINGYHKVKFITDSTYIECGTGTYPPDYLEPTNTTACLAIKHQGVTIDTLYYETGSADTIVYSGGIDFITPENSYVSFNVNECMPFPFQAPGIASYPTVRKFNLYTGEIDWEVFFNIDNQYFPSISTEVIQDGSGVFVYGQMGKLNELFWETEYDAFILKLDNTGTPVGVEDNESLKLCNTFAYPNPASSTLNIRIAAQQKNCTIQIYNLSGKLLQTKTNCQETNSFDISTLHIGEYIYKVSNTTGFIESEKFVISR